MTLPYTLNAIPVSSGGNVTVNGQQYISDYVDIAEKKLVRLVGQIDNLGALNWSGGGLDGYNEKFFTVPIDDICSYDNNTPARGLSTISKYFVNWNTINWTKTYGLYDKTVITSYNGVLAIRDIKYSDTDTFKQAMQGAKLIYELATPLEIDLTDAEVQAFKDLCTYSPTTVVSVSSEQLTPYIEFGLS